MSHPCLSCGACCTQYRVSFHWSETDPGLGGQVPVELTAPLRLHERVMLGTEAPPIRCVALDAQIGVYSRCTIHPRRPSVCRQVDASWEFGQPSTQCDAARKAHGLPVLTADDWRWREAANAESMGDGDGNPDDNGNTPPAMPPPIAA